MSGRTKLTRAVLAGAMLVTTAAGAFTTGGRVPTRPGFLDHPSDQRWVFFQQTKVVADHARGIYTATFAPFLSRVDDTDFSISGFMMATGAATSTRHFILTRRNSSCPFCPPNEPTEAIEVFTRGPVALSNNAVNVQGRLHLVSRSSEGLFYRLEGASIL